MAYGTTFYPGFNLNHGEVTPRGAFVTYILISVIGDFTRKGGCMGMLADTGAAIPDA